MLPDEFLERVDSVDITELQEWSLLEAERMKEEQKTLENKAKRKAQRKAKR